MGSGVALAVKQKYPRVYDAYKQRCDKFEPKFLLGSMQFVFATVSSYDVVVVNAFTQLDFGAHRRQVSYDAINDIFEELATHTLENHTLNIPRIGAGLGGGNWGIIEKIINTHITTEVICWDL